MGKTISLTIPQITINRLYKPFPNGCDYHRFTSGFAHQWLRHCFNHINVPFWDIMNRRFNIPYVFFRFIPHIYSPKIGGLVGGFKHEFYVPFHIWDVILPIDELHHFSRWLKPPTSIIAYNIYIAYGTCIEKSHLETTWLVVL